MKQKQVINLTINVDGSVEVSPEGFKGKSCRDATKFLEQALGLDVSKRKDTPEFYATETVGQKQSV
jgi:hypothetical protein